MSTLALAIIELVRWLEPSSADRSNADAEENRRIFCRVTDQPGCLFLLVHPCHHHSPLPTLAPGLCCSVPPLRRSFTKDEFYVSSRRNPDSIVFMATKSGISSERNVLDSALMRQPRQMYKWSSASSCGSG